MPQSRQREPLSAEAARVDPNLPGVAVELSAVSVASALELSAIAANSALTLFADALTFPRAPR